MNMKLRKLALTEINMTESKKDTCFAKWIIIYKKTPHTVNIWLMCVHLLYVEGVCAVVAII